MAETITLQHERAPGDVVAMTALVRDLALTYPGRYRVYTDTKHRTVWENNPYVMRGQPQGPVLRLDYGRFIRECHRQPMHFLRGFHGSFEDLTGVRVPLTFPAPDLHLDPAVPRPVADRYWVILAGGKTDFTTKLWPPERHQRVVDSLRSFGLSVVQAGAAEKSTNHRHRRLQGVVDMLGRTDLKQLFHLIKHADGVVCTITMAMHVAAALGRPCVVTAGGREHWWWEAYHKQNPGLQPVAHRLPLNHRFLHTIGMLSCCRTVGCWRNKATRDEPDKDNSYCVDTVSAESGRQWPRCLNLLTPEKVVEACLSYYLDGTLEPTDQMRQTFLRPGRTVSLPVISEALS